MQLTLAEFVGATRCPVQVGRVWLDHINAQLDPWEINTRERVAGFLAQMAHECASFRLFEENLSYSANGLAATWPNRYSVNPRIRPLVPNALAMKLHRDQEGIANYTYANRMGNGGPETGDGWLYRGRGPKQITGKENYTRLSEDTGMDFVSDPDLLLQPEYGALSAAWYWSTHGCNQLQDAGDFEGVTKAINGGLVGYDQRLELWENAKQVLGVM